MRIQSLSTDSVECGLKLYKQGPCICVFLYFQDNVGSVLHQHHSPQSSPEVNVTNNLQSDIDDHMTSGSQVIPVGQSGGVEEDVEVPEPDEAEVGSQESTCKWKKLTRDRLVLYDKKWK